MKMKNGKKPAITTPDTSLKEGYDNSEEACYHNVTIILLDTHVRSQLRRSQLKVGTWCNLSSGMVIV